MTYFSCRGSQSTPGRSSLAACLTSSLSTETLSRCSVCAIATRIHSINGGSTMNGLEDNEQPEGIHAEMTILSKCFKCTEKNYEQSKVQHTAERQYSSFRFKTSNYLIKVGIISWQFKCVTHTSHFFHMLLIICTHINAARNLNVIFIFWCQRFSDRMRKVNI